MTFLLTNADSIDAIANIADLTEFNADLADTTVFIADLARFPCNMILSQIHGISLINGLKININIFFRKCSLK